MQDSHASEAANSSSNEPPAYRLVIRARIIPEEAPQIVEPASDRRVVGLIIAGIAALIALGWLAFGLLRTESSSSRDTSAGSRDVGLQSSPPLRTDGQIAHTLRAEPSSRPVVSTNGATSAAITPVRPPQATSVESNAPTQAEEVPPSPIDEVIPDVPRSALQTIRGTVRVAIAVTINEQGVVTGATTHNRGPSRYFERLSLEAARKWTFTPAATDQSRTLLLRFHYTRDGATVHAEPVNL